MRLMVKKKKKKKKKGQKCNFRKEKGQRTVAYDERCVRDMRLELFSWCSWKSFSGICFGTERLGFALLKLNPRRGFSRAIGQIPAFHLIQWPLILTPHQSRLAISVSLSDCFFLNNQIPQTTLLVSKVSKQINNLARFRNKLAI